MTHKERMSRSGTGLLGVFLCPPDVPTPVAANVPIKWFAHALEAINMMKKNLSLTAILSQCSLFLIFLTGAGSATAAQVNTDGSGNVTSITNLFLPLDQDPGFFNVIFVRDTAFNLYGEFLNDLPFDLNEDYVNVMNTVIEELNGESPVPPGASTAGTEFFWIGVDEENDLLAALGAKFFAGSPDEWGLCDTGCAPGGGRPLLPNATETYITFSVVPVPAAVWLFGSALGLLGWMKRNAA